MNLEIVVQRNKEIMNLEIVDLKRSQQTQAVHQSSECPVYAEKIFKIYLSEFNKNPF